MKVVTYTLGFLASSLLLLNVTAQPWQLRHFHEHEHKGRALTTVGKTGRAYERAVENVIVYVAANGERTTVTQGAVVPVSTLAAEPTVVNPAPPSVESSQASNVAEQDSYNAKGDSRGKGWGFAYAPFKSDGKCKSADEIKKDFEQIGKDYSLVRIYGTSCDQVTNVLAAAQKYNLQIFAGIFNIDQLELEAKILIDAAKKDWNRFDTVSIGNELVNAASNEKKASTAAKVVDKIKVARSILKSAGFQGKVVTVDTLVAARAYPTLCQASDYCAVNCHPFFDGNVGADAAGNFISEQIATLAKVIPKAQRIVVTETGWPWKGANNNAAIPSLPNQAKALDSIKRIFESNKSGVILFTIYNDLWKQNTAATFGAEQYWGFQGLDAPSG